MSCFTNNNEYLDNDVESIFFEIKDIEDSIIEDPNQCENRASTSYAKIYFGTFLK